MTLRLEAIILSPNEFSISWNDKGSGSSFNVQTWNPNPPKGYFSVGSCAESSAQSWIYGSSPRETVVVLKDVSDSGDIALKNPKDFSLVWKDSGSGAEKDGSFWRPIAPESYVALGDVAVLGYGKPSLNTIMCVHTNLVLQGRCGPEIWDDKSSGAQKDVSLWRTAIQPQTSLYYLPVGTFITSGSHSPPNDSLFKILKISSSPVIFLK